MSVPNWIWLWWDAASWLRISPVLKVDSSEKLLNWLKEIKNGIERLEIEITKMAFVISGLEYKNTLVFLFPSLTLCKNFLEFCLGLLWLIFPTPLLKWVPFSIYMAAQKWTYPRFGTHGSALGFWKLDILHENPEILTDF